MKSINPTALGLIVIAFILTVVAITSLSCLNYTR